MIRNAFRWKYVPNVHTPFGETDDTVKALWVHFREFMREFSALRFEYTHGELSSGAHFHCTEAERKPVLYAFVRHHDDTGQLTHTSAHPNLLCPEYWGDGRLADQTSLVLPGIFPNEIGATA